MNSRSWLILIAFLMTTSGSTYWYTCKIKGFCNGAIQEEKAPSEKKQPEKDKYGALDYLWSDPNPRNGAEWLVFKEQILAGAAEGKVLNIVGPYYAEESNSTIHANLGIARAEAIKAIFQNEIGAENIQIQSRMIVINKEYAMENPFDGSQYITWVINNDFVKEIDGKALVYFPSSSSKEITTTEIVDYLNKLVETLNKNPEYTLQVVGHTDTQGEAKSNYDLGMKRAKQIKSLLLDKGVAEDRINAMSRGEEDPIGDNETEEGRQKNRRTELIINK